MNQLLLVKYNYILIKLEKVGMHFPLILSIE